MAVERCLACEADTVGAVEGSRLNAGLGTSRFLSGRELGPESGKAGGSPELPSAWRLSRFAKVNLACEQNRCTQNRAGSFPGAARCRMFRLHKR
jgi:hypothetical protein